MTRPSRRPPTRNPRGLGAGQQAEDREVTPPVPAGRNNASPRRSSSESRESPRQPAPQRRSNSVPRPRGVLYDIHRLQNSVRLVIPKLPFGRVIREVLHELSGRDLRITRECLMATQEASEIFLVQLLEDAYRCTLHRDRVTLHPKDLRLALDLRKSL